MVKVNLKPYKKERSQHLQKKRRRTARKRVDFYLSQDRSTLGGQYLRGKFYHAHQATSGAGGDKLGYHLVVGVTP